MTAPLGSICVQVNLVFSLAGL